MRCTIALFALVSFFPITGSAQTQAKSPTSPSYQNEAIVFGAPALHFGLSIMASRAEYVQI